MHRNVCNSESRKTPREQQGSKVETPSREGRRFKIFGDRPKQIDIGESRTLHESDKATEWRRRAAKGGDMKLAKAAVKT